MPIVTARESIDQVYGSLEETSPTPDEQAAGRTAALDEALDNLSSSVAAVSAYRLYADRTDPRRLSREDASKFAEENGVSDLKGIGDAGISPTALQLLVARQQRKMERARRIETAELGGVEQFALGFTGGFADPLNLIGIGWAGRSRSLLGAAAKGAAIGAGVTAAAEPVFFGLSRFAGDDYTLQDSMLNVAMGGAFGTAFHGAGHVIGGLRERQANAAHIAARGAEDLPPEARDIVAFEDLSDQPTPGTLTEFFERIEDQRFTDVAGTLEPAPNRVGQEVRLRLTDETPEAQAERAARKTYADAMRDYVAKGGEMPRIPYFPKGEEVPRDLAHLTPGQRKIVEDRRERRAQERAKRDEVPGPVGRDPRAKEEFSKTKAASEPAPPKEGEEAAELRKQFTAEERAFKAARKSAGKSDADEALDNELKAAETAEDPPIDYDTLGDAVRCALKKGGPRGL